MTKKTVFLTGATGVMGMATLQELVAKSDDLHIKVLARDSAVNHKKLAPFIDKIEVLWGDLLNADDVMRGVTGADYVLHVGGMVSPKADYFPKKTPKVNITAAENIVNAALAQPDEKQPYVVYIGSSTGGVPVIPFA